MSYERRVDRNHPSCIVMLIDQSSSMSDPMAGSARPKATVVAEQLNDTIMELVSRCTPSPMAPPRRYFALDVIGYRTAPDGDPIVRSCLQVSARQDHRWVWSDEIAVQPLRVEQRSSPDGEPHRAAVWVEPRHDGGTPLCAALDRAGRTAKAFVEDHPDSFPPIIINLGDGESTDGHPRVWADRLRSIECGDGAALFFNVMVARGDEDELPVEFPHSEAQLSTSFARLVFRMSSELPEFMATAARRKGLAVEHGARGMSMNADLGAVVEFLNVGTATPGLQKHVLR